MAEAHPSGHPNGIEPRLQPRLISPTFRGRLEYSKSWNNSLWSVHDISGPEGLKFDLNLLLDLDGDGDLDVINTEENNNARDGEAGLGLIWYEKPER